MPATATSSAPQPLEMIEAMTVCAYELGLAAGEMAKRAEDTKRFLAMSTEFRHCFFAMRMGIRMRHWSPAAMNARESTAPAERLETERPEAVERPQQGRGTATGTSVSHLSRAPKVLCFNPVGILITLPPCAKQGHADGEYQRGKSALRMTQEDP